MGFVSLKSVLTEWDFMILAKLFIIYCFVQKNKLLHQLSADLHSVSDLKFKPITLYYPV